MVSSYDSCDTQYICVCTGGGYSFMQTATNEDSSTTNIQDFFSQFGKTDASSNTGGAGTQKIVHVYNVVIFHKPTFSDL